MIAGDMTDSDSKPDIASVRLSPSANPFVFSSLRLKTHRSRAYCGRKRLTGNRRIGNAPIRVNPRNPTGSCRSTADTALMISRQLCMPGTESSTQANTAGVGTSSEWLHMMRLTP